MPIHIHKRRCFYEIQKFAINSMTIELCDEFLNLRIAMRTPKIIMDNAIVDSLKDRRTVRTRVERLIKSGQVEYLNPKDSRSVWLCHYGALHFGYPGAWVLDILVTTSAEAAEMARCQR